MGKMQETLQVIPCILPGAVKNSHWKALVVVVGL